MTEIESSLDAVALKGLELEILMGFLEHHCGEFDSWIRRKYPRVELSAGQLYRALGGDTSEWEAYEPE